VGPGGQREDDTESSVAGISPHTTRLFGAVTPEPDNTLDPTARVTDTRNLDAPQTQPEKNHLTQRGFALALLCNRFHLSSGCRGRSTVSGCHDRRVGLFAVTRSDIESFARNLEELGRARAAISRRLCTITCLYRYAVKEGMLDRSPAVHVRRPRLDYESNATGLDRNRSAQCSSPPAWLGHAITP